VAVTHYIRFLLYFPEDTFVSSMQPQTVFQICAQSPFRN